MTASSATPALDRMHSRISAAPSPEWINPDEQDLIAEWLREAREMHNRYADNSNQSLSTALDHDQLLLRGQKIIDGFVGTPPFAGRGA